MQEIMRGLNKKKCIWIVAVLLISLLSSRYVVFVVGKLTAAIVGNNVFVFLLVLTFHILAFGIMGSTCFDIKRIGIISVLSLLLVLLLKKVLFGGDFTLILAIEAGAFLFVTGYVCSYFMKRSARYFFLLLGECALFLMNHLVPVFSDFSLTLFAVLTAVAFGKMQKIYREPEMEVFRTLKAKILFCLLDIYASFALVGHNAFLKNASVEITPMGVIAYCLCLFIMYSLLMLLTYGLVKIRPIIKRQEESTSRYAGVRVQIKCFLFMMVPLFIILMGFYPTIMTTDGLSQWGQAIGVWAINDSHPAIHTLFIKLCSELAKTPYMVSVVQAILFSLLWSFILKYLYQCGKVSEGVLYIISFGIALAPTNYMMLFLVSKNILYGIIVLCTTFLFVKFYSDESFLDYKMVFCFGTDLALLYLVRHNGFVGTAVSCVMLMSTAIYKLRKRKSIYCLKICSVIATMIASIAVVRGPVYSYFQVQNNASNIFACGPLVQAAGIYYLADKDIPTEVKEIVDRIGTKEQWLANYNPYDGDKLSWSELRDALQSADKGEMVKLYFTLLKNDPLLVIKARLNAVDLLWNIFEPTETYRHYGGHNNSYYGGITVDPGYEKKFPDLLKEEYRQQSGTYVKTNTITMVCRRLNAISYQNDAFKIIFWRNGIYLVILFWLFIVNALEGYKKIILAGLVPLATLGSLALAASWQIYQYYWFFPICVLFLALVTVAEKYDLQVTVELHYMPNSLYDRKRPD